MFDIPTFHDKVWQEWFDKTVLWYCKERTCYEMLLPHFQTMSKHDKIMVSASR